MPANDLSDCAHAHTHTQSTMNNVATSNFFAVLSTAKTRTCVFCCKQITRQGHFNGASGIAGAFTHMPPYSVCVCVCVCVCHYYQHRPFWSPHRRPTVSRICTQTATITGQEIRWPVVFINVNDDPKTHTHVAKQHGPTATNFTSP